MHKRWKLLAISAVAALGAGLLAGCSSGGSGSGSDTISIWYRPGSLPTAAINGVKKEFPDAKISLLKTPDVDTKLAAALRTGQNIPSIAVTNVFTFSNALDKFVDVNKYGFKKDADQYLPWKVKTLQSKSGQQVAIPIDIGPIGFYYRSDVFQAAGLPTDPADVGKLVSTWDSYRQTAEKIKASSGGFICDAADASLYRAQRFQQGYYYYTDAGKVDAGTALSKSTFTDSIQFAEDGLCLNAEPYATDWNAGVAQNKLVGWVGPAYQAGLMKTAAPNESGKWRVATPPGGPASTTGSSLSVLKATPDAALATKIAEWLTNPTNMAAGYAQDSLFPSTPDSFTSPAMAKPDEYFGGQVTTDVLGPIAKQTPYIFIGPSSTNIEAAFSNAITNAVAKKTNPEAAWSKVLKQVQQQYK